MNNNQNNFNDNPQISNMNQNSIIDNNINTSSRFFKEQQPPQNIQNSVNQNQSTFPNINVIPTMGATPQPTITNQQPNEIVANNIENNITNINPQNTNQEQPSLKDMNIFDEKITPPPIQTNYGGFSEVNDELKLDSTNRFINNEINADNNTNQLTIEEEYSNMPKQYSMDEKVQKNIEKEKKKNTITLTGEAKVFLLIIAILVLFTFVMPYIFDFFRGV